jgi:orotidine-5'-phosphate decarboxylase
VADGLSEAAEVTVTSFSDRLTEAVDRLRAPACVGLDPHLERLPLELYHPDAAMSASERRAHAAEAVQTWGMEVAAVLAGRVPAVKPQAAFFEALGAPGVAALECVVARCRELGLLVVLDVKRGDIGSTAAAYAQATLADEGPMGADSVTLSPYLGEESLQPFERYCGQGKGLFVLVRTSNPGAGAWQTPGDPSFARRVAAWVERANSSRLGAHGLGPVGAVIGATLGDEIPVWRAAMPSAWFLVPGYGAQGAGPADVVPCFRADGRGALITSSRGVLFGTDAPTEPGWRQGVARRTDELVSTLRRHIPGV